MYANILTILTYFIFKANPFIIVCFNITDHERNAKSEKDSETTEASGFGAIEEIGNQEKTIDSQLKHLNQLIKSMRKSDDNETFENFTGLIPNQNYQPETDFIPIEDNLSIHSNGSNTTNGIKNQNTNFILPSVHKEGFTSTTTKEFVTHTDFRENQVASTEKPKRDSIKSPDEDVLKLLLQLSTKLLSRHSQTNLNEHLPPPAVAPYSENILQPIVRPIYITVPIQTHPFTPEAQKSSNANQSQQQQNLQQQDLQYNDKIVRNQIYQDFPIVNMSQIQLMNSYGQPISGYPDYPQAVNSYYSSPTYQTNSRPSYYEPPNQLSNYHPYFDPYGYRSSYIVEPQYRAPGYYQWVPQQTAKVSDTEYNPHQYDEVDDDRSISSEVESESSEELTGVKRYVEVEGNIYPYDHYKTSVLPLIRGSYMANQVKIFTCTTGTREPNRTDCTKYFVCNPQTGGIYPFTCPINTAFNERTKFCDTKTYQACKKSNKNKHETLSKIADKQRETTKLQYETLKAIEELKRIKQETLQIQSFSHPAHMQSFSNIRYQPPTQVPNVVEHDSITQLLSFLQNRVSNNNNENKIQNLNEEETIQTTPKIIKRKRLTCLQPGKVADPDSLDHYYLCFKTPDNFLKLHKMKCPERFIFCKKTLLCALPGTCM